MAAKLGDLLLKEGLITTSQLEEALKYQVIFGGKLGTNLIEMGFLEEDDIARALGKIFGVPVADSDEMMQVPGTVLELLSRDLVEKFGVFPLKKEGRRLTLVMPDPSAFKVIDEISFRTGLIVRPVVASEVRLILALEKFYQIERDRRYIQAVKQVSPKRKPKPKAAASEPPAPAPAAPPVAPVAVAEQFIDIPLPEAAPVEVEELLELAEEVLPEAEELPTAEALVEEEPLELADAETVNESLAEAYDRDDILDTMAAFLASEFPRTALFLVKGDMALGWKCSVDGTPVAGFNQVQIPLDEPSVLKTVVETRSFLLGPLARTPFNSMLLQELGGTVPETALLVPLQMMGRVVGIFYVDGKGVNLGERLFELQKLTAKAAMAFEILVLKNKILSM